jgi:hypothetical protein
MAFPTTSILDTFNRANEGPYPSTNWDGKVLANDGASWAVLANQCKAGGGDNSRMYWKSTTFGPDCEAYCTIATVPISGTFSDIALLLRLQQPGTGGAGGTTTDGYYIGWVHITGTDSLIFYRIDNQAFTQLGTTQTPLEMANGHKFGASMIGSTLQAYVDTGGGWTTLGTPESDPTYGAAGYIGILTGQSASTIDDFGGGNVLSSTSSLPCAVSAPLTTAITLRAFTMG